MEESGGGCPYVPTGKDDREEKAPIDEASLALFLGNTVAIM